MKNLCLIFDQEKQVDAMPKRELNAGDEEHLAYYEVLRENGHFIVTEALQPIDHDRARPQRQAVYHRRTLCRDQRAVGRLISDRRQGPERGYPGGPEDLVGACGSIEVLPSVELKQP